MEGLEAEKEVSGSETITTEEVKKHVLELALLLSGKELLDRPDSFVPKGAEAFIGQQRAEIAEKCKAIVDLGWGVLSAYDSEIGLDEKQEEAGKKKLNDAIRRIASAAVNSENGERVPGKAVELAARIWKYLNENRRGVKTGEERIGPANFETHLEEHYKLLFDYEPLSSEEKGDLFRAIGDISKGVQIVDVLDTIDRAIKLAFDRANPMSRAGRNIVGREYRNSLNQYVQRLQKVRDFIEKTYGGGKKFENLQNSRPSYRGGRNAIWPRLMR